MSVPSLALTFRDLYIRVAEFLGIADYSGGVGAQPPVDAGDLERVKRIVNDGYRKFILSNDRWQFLTPTITITFVAGTNTYDMPDGFYGSVLVPWTYPATGPKTRIDNITEERIRELNAAGAASGDPTLVAFLPKNITPATGAPRWSAVFWPTPANAYTVTSRARLFPDKLTGDGDYHLGGFQHDESVLLAALSEAERQVDDQMGVQAKQFADALARSKMVDMQASPRRLGDYGDKSESRFGTWQRPSNYYSVDTYNGNPV